MQRLGRGVASWSRFLFGTWKVSGPPGWGRTARSTPDAGWEPVRRALGRGVSGPPAGEGASGPLDDRTRAEARGSSSGDLGVAVGMGAGRGVGVGLRTRRLRGVESSARPGVRTRGLLLARGLRLAGSNSVSVGLELWWVSRRPQGVSERLLGWSRARNLGLGASRPAAWGRLRGTGGSSRRGAGAGAFRCWGDVLIGRGWVDGWTDGWGCFRRVSGAGWGGLAARGRFWAVRRRGLGRAWTVCGRRLGTRLR